MLDMIGGYILHSGIFGYIFLKRDGICSFVLLMEYILCLF